MEPWSGSFAIFYDLALWSRKWRKMAPHEFLLPKNHKKLKKLWKFGVFHLWSLFVHKIIFFTTKDFRTGRAFEITDKMTISQNHGLTSIESTKNPCSYSSTYIFGVSTIDQIITLEWLFCNFLWFGLVVVFLAFMA